VAVISYLGTKIEATLGIPFSTIPRKRKPLGFLFRGTNVDTNTWNSVPNHSAEEKTTRNFFRGTKFDANTWNSVPNHSAEEKTTWNFVPWNKNRSKLSEFCSEAFCGQKHTLNSVCWIRIFFIKQIF
jgi:hypothetical protein